jgi:predicted DsbA family dithiol-disulfide isomerase
MFDLSTRDLARYGLLYLACGTWADTLSGDGAIHDALFKAYFVDARNVIADRRFKDAVDADWAKPRQFGVTGVPTFVAEGRGVVGAQPYEMLVQLMEAAGARPRGDGGESQSDSS